jgi:Flp pilus assembly pilin Flp
MIDLIKHRSPRGEGGQALVEYALVVSLVALVCVGALTAIGVNVNQALQFPSGL